MENKLTAEETAMEKLIRLLQSKHDNFIGTQGELVREEFKNGLAWAISSAESQLHDEKQQSKEMASPFADMNSITPICIEWTAWSVFNIQVININTGIREGSLFSLSFSKRFFIIELFFSRIINYDNTY
jgi:hypothetical protein